jgi:hypothetical protein
MKKNNKVLIIILAIVIFISGICLGSGILSKENSIEDTSTASPTVTEIPPTPTNIPTPTKVAIEEDDGKREDFISYFSLYFGHIVSSNTVYSDYNLYDTRFFEDDEGVLWFAVTVTGSSSAEDDAIIMGIISAIVSTEIEDKNAEFFREPEGVMILFMNNNFSSDHGAFIFWDGLKLYTEGKITADDLFEFYIAYPITIEDNILGDSNS